MEIGEKNGILTALPLNLTSATEFGRGLGFNTNDRTVSRHHITFRPKFDKNNQIGQEFESTVRFEVTGKNPVWIRSSKNGIIKVFRRGDEGEMKVGDFFCISGETLVWFGLKRKKYKDEVFESPETTSSRDVSDVDPVKEFGFIVMGHEFDNYSTKMIRDIKKRDWFLEEIKKDSDDENTSEKKVRARKKRKNTSSFDNDDDDEWTGDSEEDKEVVLKPKKFQKPNYSTRSKGPSLTSAKNLGTSKNGLRKNSIRANESENDDEDEDEETLGGFIVDEEDEEQEIESDVDEEEFDEDEED